MKSFIIPVVACISLTASLKCWNTPQGFLYNSANNATLLECVGMAYSCIKVVDYTQQTYTKGCFTSNCSNPNTAYQPGVAGPAACFSNNAPRYPNDPTHNVTSCCCYGDGCNPASQKMIGGAFAFIMTYIFM